MSTGRTRAVDRTCRGTDAAHARRPATPVGRVSSRLWLGMCTADGERQRPFGGMVWRGLLERVVESFVAEISDVEHCLDARRLRLRSRDRHAVSPLLASSLKGKVADISVTPKTLDEVKRVVAAAATRRIPITVKGGGTANYGQSVPLHGGILLEMHRLDDIRFVGADAIRVGAGLTFGRLDAHARQSRRELRIHPSTRQTATVGGHLAGGQGGPGSVTHGVLSDPGNVLAVQIVTMEVEPRVLELRGGDVQRVYHTYGTTGIITEVELPLAPAYRWREAVVAFGEFSPRRRASPWRSPPQGFARRSCRCSKGRFPASSRRSPAACPTGSRASR